MFIVENTLNCTSSTWSDPGPSRAGGMSALQSHSSVESIDGHVILQLEDNTDLDLTADDLTEDDLSSTALDLLSEGEVYDELELDDSVEHRNVKWCVDSVDMSKNQVTLSIEDF